jgi:type 1 fimbria pilin
MDSNDEVLKNLESNNPNVGIQLEYVDNYSTTKMTVKNGTAFQVLQNAGANETLNFNSYYYYKGGSSTVNGGLVKSNAEFLFAYE